MGYSHLGAIVEQRRAAMAKQLAGGYHLNGTGGDLTQVANLVPSDFKTAIFFHICDGANSGFKRISQLWGYRHRNLLSANAHFSVM